MTFDPDSANEPVEPAAEVPPPEEPSVGSGEGDAPTDSTVPDAISNAPETIEEPDAIEENVEPARTEEPSASVPDESVVVPGTAPSAPGMRIPPPPPKRPAGAVQVGRIVTVNVSAIHPHEVEVRLADGRTGVITRPDLGEGAAPGVGDPVEAALLARDDPKGRVVLSRAWAQKQAAWQRIEEARDQHTPITGRVTKVVKGGLVMDVGVRGFLPASLIEEQRVEDPSAYVGRELEVVVTEADRAADRVVVSRRDLLRQERRRRERESLSAIEPGRRVTGRVVSVADYGAVLDLGGLRGLVHRSELSWHRIEHPSEIVKVGDELEVEVLEVNRNRKRISLSLRRTQPDPFAGVELGTVDTATVVRVVEYGVFARLDTSGAEGLVHISELSDVPGFRPEQLVAPGEQVMVKVIEVDHKRRRLGLSVRQAILEAPPT